MNTDNQHSSGVIEGRVTSLEIWIPKLIEANNQNTKKEIEAIKLSTKQSIETINTRIEIEKDIAKKQIESVEKQIEAVEKQIENDKKNTNKLIKAYSLTAIPLISTIIIAILTGIVKLLMMK